MANAIFLNLPVRDLERSKAFYWAVGAKMDPKYSEDGMACMPFSETIRVMLLTHDKWTSFTTKPICDATSASEVMVTMTFDTRDAVDAMVNAAGANGGKSDINPAHQNSFVYNRSYEDPDGHIWDLTWMDLAAHS